MTRKKAYQPVYAPAPEPIGVPEAVVGAPPAAVSNRITNCIKGSTLHIGDGRQIAFGESAEVSEDLAAFLRERGQAE